MTFLDMQPPALAALEAETERELEADREEECGMTLRDGRGSHRCYFRRGHTGPCSWARET